MPHVVISGKDAHPAVRAVRVFFFFFMSKQSSWAVVAGLVSFSGSHCSFSVDYGGRQRRRQVLKSTAPCAPWLLRSAIPSPTSC